MIVFYGRSIHPPGVFEFVEVVGEHGLLSVVVYEGVPLSDPVELLETPREQLHDGIEYGAIGRDAIRGIYDRKYIPYDRIRCGRIRYDRVRYDRVRCGRIRYDRVRYGRKRYGRGVG